MKEFECSTCSERWNGAYNNDGRCVTCGGVVTEIEPLTTWRVILHDHKLLVLMAGTVMSVVIAIANF